VRCPSISTYQFQGTFGQAGRSGASTIQRPFRATYFLFSPNPCGVISCCEPGGGRLFGGANAMRRDGGWVRRMPSGLGVGRAAWSELCAVFLLRLSARIVSVGSLQPKLPVCRLHTRNAKPRTAVIPTERSDEGSTVGFRSAFRAISA
jgi:hypothetical protein